VHRVFRTTVPAPTAEQGPASLRRFFRSLGLDEEPSGTCYLYFCLDAAGRRRQLASLSGSPHRATVYLYPDALARGTGVANALYRSLDEAGVELGSKAGPSIAIDLEDAAQVELFCAGLATLVSGSPSSR